MPVEIKEIVVKTHVDSSQIKDDKMSSDKLKKIMEDFKEEIINEVTHAVFNQVNKNDER